jgi:hypothetical protein
MGELNQNDKIEIEANAEGAKVSISGEGTSRIVDAIADFISPISQGMGVIGDQISYFRIHRSYVAAEALEKARRFRESRGQPITPVSTKLLAPWIEAVSGEDVGQDDIIGIYARILAEAGDKFDPLLRQFIDICGSIGSAEANILKSITQDNFLALGKFDDLTAQDWSQHKLSRIWSAFVSENGDFPPGTNDQKNYPNAEQAEWYNIKLEKFEISEFDIPLSTSIRLRFTFKNASGLEFSTSKDMLKYDIISLDILSNIGLLANKVAVASSKNSQLQLQYYFLTPVGQEFCKLVGSDDLTSGSK